MKTKLLLTSHNSQGVSLRTFSSTVAFGLLSLSLGSAELMLQINTTDTEKERTMQLSRFFLAAPLSEFVKVR